MAGKLTGLHAKLTGDSTSFVRATTLAAMALRKQEEQAKKAKQAQDALAASGVGLSKEFHRLKMETDNAYAGMVRYNNAAEVARKVAVQQKWSQEQLGTELQRLAVHYGVAEQAGFNMSEQVRAGRFHTANLAAQFNDIGVMMASGQSPFIMAIQQGTQVSQVLNDMGGGAKATGKALLTAFTSIISPVSLITIGLIAGAGYLYQWGSEAAGAGKKTLSLDKAVDALGDSIALYSGYAKTAQEDTKTLVEEFGRYALEVQNLSLWMSNVALAKAYADATAAVAPLQTSLSGVSELIASIVTTQTQLNELSKSEAMSRDMAKGRLIEYNDRLAETAVGLGLSVEQVTELSRLMGALKNEDMSLPQMRDAVSAILAYFQAIVPEGEKLPQQFQEVVIQLEAVLRKLSAATKQADALSKAAPKEGWMTAAISGTDALIARLDKAITRADYLRQQNLEEISKDPDERGSQRTTVAGANTRMPDQPWLDKDKKTGGGGGAKTNPLENELEQLQNSLLSKEQLEMESYARRQELLKNALDQKMITQEDYARMMEQVDKTHQFAMLQSTNDGVSATLSALGSLFQGSKKIGAAVAIANSWIAFTEVLKDPSYVGRPGARFTAAAAALSSGFNAVRNIKSAQPGGSASGGTGGGSAGAGGAAAPQTSSQVALQLVGGDMFSRDQVLKLINAINQATSDGARILLK